MKRLAMALLLGLAVAALLPAGASGAFGFNHFDVELTDADGQLAPAGSHPEALTTSFGTNTSEDEGILTVEGQLKDLVLEQAPGLVADSTAYKACSTLQFLLKECPLESVVGITANSLSEVGLWNVSPLYNVAPPPGVLVRFGFSVDKTNILVDAGLSQSPPYIPLAASRNTAQMVSVFANKTQVWGEPADEAHDGLRGPCGSYIVKFPTLDIPGFDFESQGECPVEDNPRPFLTAPTSCAAPLPFGFEALSWAGEPDSGSVLSHEPGGGPRALGGCERLGLAAQASAQPTNRSASGPSGLHFSLDIDDVGLTETGAARRAFSHVRQTTVTLPEGMTANPSLAAGLEVCSESDLGRESLSSVPGQGCPQAAKIGTIEVESPLVSESIGGSLYQATPHANQAGNALIALYIVLRNEKLGILVKQPVRVDPDPATGRLTATAAELPQLPFSSFRLRFREGARSPLITPPRCGDYETLTRLDPWSGGEEVRVSSTFSIATGPAGGPCPPGGAPPFEPGFGAGSANNAAGRHSPFSMRLTRRDGDQDLTRFDATLPPGVSARLAGVPWCAEAAIAAARERSGRDELASPSCPQASRIGTVAAGAGAGPQLTYVPGSVYLAGPIAGAPLSAVAIVPAVAGPFDVGTVVYRQALRVDPRSARVSADGAASDPLPHILAGIPLAVRDIQVAIDRPDFTLNPTNCDPAATLAEIWGGGGNAFSAADDFPVLRQARYQAAGCGELGFAPRLAIKLRGGTRRGANPALRAHVRPRPGDANFSRAVVTLPRSAFLEQAHIRTICTRVQFAAGPGNGALCPKGARYGYARAWSPLIAGPAQGPVYLRSSNNKLPDLVAALKGPASAPIDFELSARIDSIRGGIRSTFTAIPDLPVSRFILDMQGGRKGLIVNSRNLCQKPARNRAKASLRGQNAKLARSRPRVVATKCAKRRKARRANRAHRRP